MKKDKRVKDKKEPVLVKKFSMDEIFNDMWLFNV